MYRSWMHDLAASERRPHDRGDVVRAVGRVEQRLGARRDVAAMVQHDLAHLDADLGAAGFARAHDRAALPAEPLAEVLGLSGLAGAVAALEGDEEARAAHFFVADFFAGAFFVVVARFARGAAGPLSRLICSSSTARSKVTSSTDSARGIVAFVVPSVT